MTYDELERLKVEADRWIAGVAGSLGDSVMIAEASRGIRALLDKASFALPEDTRAIELRVLKEISDELSLHGHALAAARVERLIHHHG